MTKYSLPYPLPLKNPHSPFRNFNFIRPIRIKGTTTPLRDYSVRIVLNNDNFPLEKCKPDGSDIRFRDETGEALPFWIESWSANEAVVWCKVPFIPASRTKDIWIVFGNPNAKSASSGKATFDFFNDFEGSDIPIDYFTDGGRGEATYCIISPHGTHYGDKTFIVWQGVSLDPYAIEYNHTTETWSSEYKVGTNPLGSDSHGCPSILRDSSGYLHVFYGCHGTSGCSGDNCYIQHAKSTNTDDISSWTDKGNIGPSYATYPNPVLVNSDIYLIFRRMAGTNHFVEAFIKSTDGGESWGASTDIIDFGSGYAIYLGNIEREGTSKIHFAWCYHDYSAGKRLNVYHAYLDLSDMHMYSMNGTDLGTTITKSEADTHCLVYSSGGAATNFPKVHLDSSGTPYIIFVNDDSGAKFKYTKWNGSSWDTPTVITSTDDTFNSHDFYVHSSSNIELYLIGSGLSGKGGDVEKWTFDGSSWTKVATLVSESSQGKPLNNPVFVYNFDSDLKVVFSEAYGGGTDYTTPQKVFAYGDSGFVQSIGHGVDFENEAEGAFKIVGGTYLDSDGIGSGSEWHGPRGSSDLPTPLSNFEMKAKIRQTVSTSGEERHAIYLCDASGNIVYYFYLGDNWAGSALSITGLREGGGMDYEANVPSGSTLLYESGSTSTWNDGEWVFKLIRNGTNLDLSYDGNSLWSGSSSLSTNIKMIKWAIMGYGTYPEITTHMYDYIMVRKYASPEPVAIL